MGARKAGGLVATAAIVAGLVGVAGASLGQAPRPAAGAAERPPPRDLSRARQSIVDYAKGVAQPAMDCAALKAADFGAPVKILSADPASAPGTPAYCHVVGLIEGRIRFEVALPASWNRRLLQIGNGGVAGEAVPGTGEREAQRLVAVKNGFVFTANDMGHVADARGTSDFAKDNPDSIVDFGYRAHHLDNLWARRIAERYYGTTVARAYYSGCSTGGRSGYSEAQRYPDDFDGILAGAPVYNLVSLSLVNTFNAAILTRSGLTQEAYAAAVSTPMLAKCDALDGVKDGVISDPRQCHFDIAKEAIRCGQPGAQPGQCLTPQQVQALVGLQADVVVGGKRVYPGKILSSDNMARFLPAPRQLNPPSRETADQVIRTMSLYPHAGPYPQITWETVNLDRDFNRTAPAKAVLESDNPDLAAFRAHGGKMISFVGWEDTGINPRSVTGYWDQVAGKLGRAETMDTFRVFLVPGMGHCQGGAGAADYFDLMTPLIEWVEAGVAPQSEIGIKRAADGSATFSRRMCPYPSAAHYLGGDAKDATSYSCVAPPAAAAAVAAGPAKAKRAG